MSEGLAIVWLEQKMVSGAGVVFLLGHMCGHSSLARNELAQ